MARYLVTGAAGFIGFHLCNRLLERGDDVLGVDNLNQDYGEGLKAARLKQLAGQSRFAFLPIDVTDRAAMATLFYENKFDVVAHLAAQTGGRDSLQHPEVFLETNVLGFGNVLEGCRRHAVSHLVYASSSSVYGATQRTPFSTRDNVDQPMSFYAATKKSNELMAYSYSHLFGLPTTGLRYFTVYGPWGRPDMALFKFTRAILAGQPIDVFNHGKMKRDFTYVGDIVEGTVRVIDQFATLPLYHPAAIAHNGSSAPPYRIYNIGSHCPTTLSEFIAILEKCLGKKAKQNFLPLQAGDVPDTDADVDELLRDTGFSPQTRLEEGIQKFVNWYRDYYQMPAKGGAE